MTERKLDVISSVLFGAWVVLGIFAIILNYAVALHALPWILQWK